VGLFCFKRRECWSSGPLKNDESGREGKVRGGEGGSFRKLRRTEILYGNISLKNVQLLYCFWRWQVNGRVETGNRTLILEFPNALGVQRYSVTSCMRAVLFYCQATRTMGQLMFHTECRCWSCADRVHRFNRQCPTGFLPPSHIWLLTAENGLIQEGTSLLDNYWGVVTIPVSASINNVQLFPKLQLKCPKVFAKK
jgi:hypothetical protein